MSGFVPGETPEGWYADPQAGPPGPPGHPGAERWWNGVQWTAHTRQPDVPAAPPVGTVTPAASAAPATELFLSRTHPDGTTSLGLPAGVQVRTPYGAVVAGPGPRVIAFLVDTAVVWLITAVLTVPLALVAAMVRLAADVPVRVPVQLSLFWLLAVAVSWAYHATCLSRSGASLGQRSMRLGVRPWQANTRLSGRQVALRSLLMTTAFAGAVVASPVLGMVAFGLLAVTVVTGTTRRGLHEVWTDTCTVHTVPQEPPGPPGLRIR